MQSATMTTTVPNFSRAPSTRPAYLDGLFNIDTTVAADHSRAPSLSRSHRSVDSLTTLHSASTVDSNSDSRSRTAAYTALAPAVEEPSTDKDDVASIRSMSQSRKPPLRLRTAFSSHRRTYPQGQGRERAESQNVSPISMQSAANTTITRDVRGSGPPNKPLPCVPGAARPPPSPQPPVTKNTTPKNPVPKARELSSLRCYYFAARNCKGWVFGGMQGDACEGCLQAGFFGSP